MPRPAVLAGGGSSAGHGWRCGCRGPARRDPARRGARRAGDPCRRLLGPVLVARPPWGGDRFAGADDAALAELGSRLGVLLHNRELDATLQAHARRPAAHQRRAARLARAARGHRRRRAPADRAQPARRRPAAPRRARRQPAPRRRRDRRGPDRGARCSHARRRTCEAIDELRSLAHGIYPPLLMDAGLVEALRRRAPQASVAGLGATTSVGRYAPRSRRRSTSAAWRRCRTPPSTRPGPPSPCTSTRRAAPPLPVDDEGPGLGTPTGRGGHGLANMATGSSPWRRAPRHASPSGGTRSTGDPHPSSPSPWAGLRCGPSPARAGPPRPVAAPPRRGRRAARRPRRRRRGPRAPHGHRPRPAPGAVAPGDALVDVFGDPAITADLVALPASNARGPPTVRGRAPPPSGHLCGDHRRSAPADGLSSP